MDALKYLTVFLSTPHGDQFYIPRRHLVEIRAEVRRLRQYERWHKICHRRAERAEARLRWFETRMAFLEGMASAAELIKALTSRVDAPGKEGK